MSKKIFDTLQMYKESIEEKGHFVYAIMLKGSQNYGLDDAESDIDANAIIIPKPSQLRNGFSKKYTFKTGDVTCHDIYEFARISAKGNPQWIEVCQTEYKIGGDLSMFKDFKVNPSALKGMVMEKVNAFDKLYPSRAVYVEKYGYDPKQLHHIMRLYDILVKDVVVYKYEGDERQYMINIKRGKVPDRKEDAFDMRDMYVDKIARIYEQKKLEYKPQAVDYEVLDDIVMNHYLGNHIAKKEQKMTKVDYKAKLRELSGMDDEELKGVRDASIEQLQIMGFPVDEVTIAVMSAQIIQDLNKFKKKVEKIYQEAIKESIEKELPEFLSTLTEGVDFVRVEKAQ